MGTGGGARGFRSGDSDRYSDEGVQAALCNADMEEPRCRYVSHMSFPHYVYMAVQNGGHFICLMIGS